MKEGLPFNLQVVQLVKSQELPLDIIHFIFERKFDYIRFKLWLLL
jgi:hypothetical protein